MRNLPEIALFLCLLPSVITYCTPREVPETSIEFTGHTIPADLLEEIPPAPTLDEYGFDLDDMDVESHQIRRNESLYLILRRYDITPLQIDQIQKSAQGLARLNRMRPGQTYRLYFQDEELVSMVWNINRLEYLILDWSGDEIDVEQGEFEVKVVEQSASGEIRNSLYETLQGMNLSQVLGAKIAEIYAWEIDFFSLRPGDSFKVLYEELWVDDEFYGIGRVHSAEFIHRSRPFKAYYFENAQQQGYFDEEGQSLQRALLKAPFEYNQRVSSGFTNNRFHPILKTNRPHHGVDYAASRGTPIIAVGDGVVTEAQRRGGNGNIVQIRHNNQYRSAYLHLDGFASGVRKGERVEQGQVIGYVGKTGLATGYHLCYRLYVNDRPVNSLTVELPASESLESSWMSEFHSLRTRYEEKLADIGREAEDDGLNSVADAVGRN